MFRRTINQVIVGMIDLCQADTMPPYIGLQNFPQWRFVAEVLTETNED